MQRLVLLLRPTLRTGPGEGLGERRYAALLEGTVEKRRLGFGVQLVHGVAAFGVSFLSVSWSSRKKKTVDHLFNSTSRVLSSSFKMKKHNKS